MTTRNFFELADDLGDYQLHKAKPIQRPQAVTVPVARLSKADVWPPEVLEQIRAIYAEDDAAHYGRAAA